jgi:hypothetical protein
MQIRETRVSRGASPFIMKADMSPIMSPVMKVCASPFIMKAGTSPIPYIEMSVRMTCLHFVSPL